MANAFMQITGVNPEKILQQLYEQIIFCQDVINKVLQTFSLTLKHKAMRNSKYG